MKIQPDTLARDFLSIGHSNIPAEHFLALLHSAGVDVVADVRSVPQSRFCPWFSQRPLAAMLIAAGIGYSPMGEALGGRPRHDRLYRDGVADYEAMAIESYYVAGLDRLLDIAARARVCLMCAEREPLDCHRCLLVARSLAERGIAIGHILHDGVIEQHTTTEIRLLTLDQETVPHACDLFASGQRDRLAAAYRRQARTVAFRRKTSARRNIAER
jgi:uncharacterized protein (DUF488 family)